MKRPTIKILLAALAALCFAAALALAVTSLVLGVRALPSGVAPYTLVVLGAVCAAVAALGVAATLCLAKRLRE